MKTKIFILVVAVFVLSYGALQAQTNLERFRNIQVDNTAKLLGPVTLGSTLDLNGGELTLDADADTSLTADTDDQIDFEVGGSDEWVMTADQFDATNGQIVNIGAAGTDFSTEGALTTAAGITTTTGGVTITAGALVLGQQSETVAAAFVITPTSPYVLMTSAAEVTSSTATGIITTTATAGQVLVLLNGNASDVLNLDGTGGTVECKANIAMGAGDTVTLIYESTDAVWYCLSNRDNS